MLLDEYEPRALRISRICSCERCICFHFSFCPPDPLRRVSFDMYPDTLDRACPSVYHNQTWIISGIIQTYEWKNHPVTDRTLRFSASQSSCSYRTPPIIRWMDCDYRDVSVDSKKNGVRCRMMTEKSMPPVLLRTYI